MAIKDVAIAAPRSRVVVDAGSEQIEIPARRNQFALLFLSIWLVGWTLGGIMAIAEVFTNFEPFLVIWLCFWAVGWIYAASTIAWQILGRETIRVESGRLIHGCRAPLWNHELGFQVDEIRNLSPNQTSFFERFQFQSPLFTFGRSGSVKFSYGAKTAYLAAGIDEAEGVLITEWLAKRLPVSARR
jgi:hypothetical protein